ncbi:hypothetical protein C8F01DRAFT_1219937 [Mycena amicta]|nr:hypothetical protein C8F01DRAFT_1219937 [Mycena amicta]
MALRSRPCKICNKAFSLQGITGHEASCDKKKKATEKAIAFNARHRLQQQQNAHCDPHCDGPTPALDAQPWSPFPTRLDFDVADFANENMLNKGAIDELISLIRRVAANISDFTLANGAELDDYWKLASTKCTAFEKRDVTVRYKTVPHIFEMHVRPLWKWTMDLITDPHLAPYFTWDAERSYRFNGTKYVRFIKEPWMADEYWDLQSGLPETSDEHAKLCPYILYADKAKLSSFGTQKGYPIIARLTNMTIGIRNTTKWGGGAVVRWIPIVAEDTNETGKTPYTNFKTAVWHASFSELLESIAPYSKTGIWVKCGDGIERQLFPVLLILAADYEELYVIYKFCGSINTEYRCSSVMTLIRGYPSLHPCPICLVHLDNLSDPTDLSPLRTAVESEQACSGQREKKLKDLGLRNVENAFWLLSPRSDVHCASSFDRLHSYDSRLWGHHLFSQLKAHVDASGTRQLSVLDKQFDKLPRWPNLNHFATVSNISFNDGSKHRDVAKMVLFAAHNLLKDKLGQLLLQCIRAYLDVDMYLDLQLQTEETIEEGQEALKRFQACQETDFSKSWNFPKAHLHQHTFRDILRKGASRNFGTKNDEAMPGKIRTAYLRLTNFKDVAPQYIREQLEVLDTAAAAADDDVEDSAQDTIEELGYARLRGRRKAVAFTVLEEEHKDDPAYLNFRSRFSTFLSRFLQAYGHALPGAKPVKFLPQHEIIPHANLKVHFKSLDNWTDADDILRCSPSFFGHERYDAVLVKTATGDIFARLVFLFTCDVDGKQLPFALIQAMDVPTGQRTAKDERLGFYRVREKARRQSEFISTHSIICGALLAPDFEKPGNYLAVDLVDTDMFFRLKKMYS